MYRNRCGRNWKTRVFKFVKNIQYFVNFSRYWVEIKQQHAQLDHLVMLWIESSSLSIEHHASAKIVTGYCRIKHAGVRESAQHLVVGVKF